MLRCPHQSIHRYHPRKGAKTRHSFTRCFHLRTIPVRGRKRNSLYDNAFCNGTIPVRGRKQTPVQPDSTALSTIPVRGRKLLCINLFELVKSTIPVRGRKQVLVSKPFIPDLYHPRKGTKNSASKKMRSFSFANLNSLFSVGCSSMNGTIAAAVIFSLLRLLHSDKMCYNKANSKHFLQN